MRQRAIVLFTGDPRRESARKGLPARLLASLHRQLIATIERRSDVELILASDSSHGFHLEAATDSALLTTPGFSEKVAGAFRFAFERGASSVLLLAGDIAGLEGELLDDAFARLDAGDDSVIGPSSDGGFYLLGLRDRDLAGAIPWDGIPWFSSSVTSSLVAELRALHATPSFLRVIDDIDDRADAVRVCRALPSRFSSLRSAIAGSLGRTHASHSATFAHAVIHRSTLALRAPPAA
jgi:glycosyltransferase A (GT-A) superfamily protein (DUF2064 family)